MPIINKTKAVAAIYNRGREVVKVYDHGTLAWQKQSSIPDYLCFTALESGTFTLTIPAAVTPTYLSYVEWSKDGRTWNHRDNSSEAVTIDVQVAQGEKVYWRGKGACTTSASASTGRQSIFSSTARFDASGRVMSLLKGDDCANYDHLERNTVDGCLNVTFAYLFTNCDTIVNAKDLVLPTFTSFHTYIYYRTFYGCGALVSLPPLPSTELAYNCYSNLAFGCSSLLNAATLPATILASGCYNSMYYGCTSLTKGSDLPATNLVLNCYYMMYNGCSSLTDTGTLGFLVTAESSCDRMFQSCSNLNYIKCLATDISATNCLRNWTNGVSSTGTFIQASGVTWPRGASGIPTGWLAYDEGEEIPNDYAACDYIHITRGSGMVADVLADKSTYGCELEYNFTQNELDAAANNNTYIPLMYYSKAVTTDPDFPKQICGQLYLRYNANWLGWQRNAGIYTRPTTGEKTTNSSATIVKRPAVTGWHYIRCAATTTDDNFICLFDDESSQTGINYYRLMNENPTDEPAEIYISCRNNATTYPIDNGGDMKYFKIIHPDGETIVADYVPCVRKSDNVAGFWDKVRLVFKSSFGTPFVAGYNQT